jgi:predicted acetyltransferase
MGVELRQASLELLPGFVDALNRGWSPDNVGGEITARRMLKAIESDAAAFIASLDDPEGKGHPITRPDGSTVPRLPGFNRWIWDGEFCGSIGLRWQLGTSELPPWVLGHIGYAVVPWKRGQGYATSALRLLLPEARGIGLDYVELTTDPDNMPSQRVILSNGGYELGVFLKDASYGGTEGVRFRIDLVRP